MTPELGLTEEQQREEKRKFLERLKEKEDFRWLMDSKQGRRFVWRLLGIAGVYRNPFAGVRETTDFNCGLQAMGQTLISEIHEVCPNQYAQMVKEQQDSAGNDDAESADASR